MSEANESSCEREWRAIEEFLEVAIELKDCEARRAAGRRAARPGPGAAGRRLKGGGHDDRHPGRDSERPWRSQREDVHGTGRVRTK